MSIFPLFFLGVMTFCHVYLFLSLRRAFGPGVWQYFAVAFLVLGLASTFLRRRIMAWPGAETVLWLSYLWLGFLMLVVMFLAGRDVLEALAALSDRFAGTRWRPYLFSPRTVQAALAVGVLAFFYSLYEARTVRIRNITVATDKLPDGVDKLRIAAFSDIHITPYTRTATIDKIVDLTNAQKPDMTAVAGDILDGRFDPDGPEARSLRRLEGRLGKFAVLGNHEVYAGLQEGIAFIRGAGLTLLRGEAAEAGGIAVVGVDDPQIRNRVEVAEALAKADPDKFILLLSHRPDAPPETVGRFDLELSGHTHGGQIWPVTIAVRFLNGFGQGLTRLPAPEGRPRKESLVYVGNGVRFWGPPVRFLAPPEITVVDVVATGR